MTTHTQQRIALTSARIAAVAVALFLLALVTDYAAARARAPRDEASIAALQKQLQGDATLAPKLAAEYDRITKALRARKARANVLSMLLIAAAAVFIGSSKWLIAMGSRTRLAPKVLVQIEPPIPVPAAGRCACADAAAAHEIDLSFVDGIVEREGTTTEAAIPILQAIQEHYRYLPDDVLARVCELTDITPAQLAGTSSFYSRFRRSPVGRHVVRVCHGTACHVMGARQITEELRRHLRIPDGADTDADRMFTIDEVACLGCCSLAPVLMVDEHTAGKLTPASARAALDVVSQKEPA